MVYGTLCAGRFLPDGTRKPIDLHAEGATMPGSHEATDLISLTYVSAATEAFSTPDLEELLSTVREQNQALGLTGMLLYASRHFIQTLEGPASVVDAAYSRISRDRRHRNLVVALREPIGSRVFPDWSMGFESLSAEQAAQLPGFNDYLAAGSPTPAHAKRLGRAGIFHRSFRNHMHQTG